MASGPPARSRLCFVPRRFLFALTFRPDDEGGANCGKEEDEENRSDVHDIPLATAFATQPDGIGWYRMAPSPLWLVLIGKQNQSFGDRLVQNGMI